jgi:hypothetical protein
MLGRDFDCGVKINGAGIASRCHRTVPRTRDRKAIFAQTAHMNLDGALDSTKRRIDGSAGGDTTGEIWDRRSPVAVRISIDPDEVLCSLHDFCPFSPA